MPNSSERSRAAPIPSSTVSRGEAAVGVGLGVEEDLGTPNSVGCGPLEVRQGEVPEILGRLQNPGPLVVDVEERLQVGEVVGGPKVVHVRESGLHPVAGRQFEEELRLERPFDVEMQFGFGKTSHERVHDDLFVLFRWSRIRGNLAVCRALEGLVLLGGRRRLAFVETSVPPRPGSATPNGHRLASVAVPSEHGGWSLTLEPVILGLLVRPSWAGLALGAAALFGFLVRTPLKLAIVDRRRGRRLPRTELAEKVAAGELVVLVALFATSLALGDRRLIWPLLAAAPLVAVGFWYDVRSRSRRLIPELAGTIGIGSVAAAIALAGGGSVSLASGLWLVAAARAVAAVLFVRVQLKRAKQQPFKLASSDSAQAVTVSAVGAGAVAGIVPWLGWGAIVILGLTHVWLVRRPPPSAPMVGAQQVVLGLFVVLTVGLAILAP